MTAAAAQLAHRIRGIHQLFLSATKNRHGLLPGKRRLKQLGFNSEKAKNTHLSKVISERRSRAIHPVISLKFWLLEQKCLHGAGSIMWLATGSISPTLPPRGLHEGPEQWVLQSCQVSE